MNNRRRGRDQGMSGLRHFRETVESSRSENKSPVTAEQPLDSVGFGAVVGNTEFVGPHALLSYTRVIVDFLSQITKKTKSISTASAYVTSGSRREFSQSFHSIDLFP